MGGFPPGKTTWESDPKAPNFPFRWQAPRGLITSHPHVSGSIKKIQPLLPNSSPALVSGFSHPCKSPPSYSDCKNRRNLVLQEQIPLRSFLRFNIFLCRCWWLKLWPMTMHSAAQRRYSFVLAVFIRVVGFNCQMISTLIWDPHHSATSAFVLKRMHFTWEKRCWTSAEQLSCPGSWWGGAALIGGPKSTVGGWLIVKMLGGRFLIFVIMLMLDWDLSLLSYIVRPVGGVCAGGFMTTHSGWDTMLSSDKAGWDSKAKQLDEVCGEGDGGVVVCL